MSEFDVVVIGAGAAGLAAARRIATAPLSLHVLEARDRAGGRGWTVKDPSGLPIELGCGWLHSADVNEWCIIAATLGFALDRTRPQWRTQWKNLGFPPADHDDFRATLGALLGSPRCRWRHRKGRARRHLSRAGRPLERAHQRHQHLHERRRARRPFGPRLLALPRHRHQLARRRRLRHADRVARRMGSTSASRVPPR